jgi:hypothetical protein
MQNTFFPCSANNNGFNQEEYERILTLLWCQYVEETDDFSSYQPLLDWVNLNIMRMNPTRDSLYSSQVVLFNQQRAQDYTNKIVDLVTLEVRDEGVGSPVFNHLPSLISELRAIAASYQDNASDCVTNALASMAYIQEFVVGFNAIQEPPVRKKLFVRLVRYLESLALLVNTVNSHLQNIQGI